MISGSLYNSPAKEQKGAGGPLTHNLGQWSSRLNESSAGGMGLRGHLSPNQTVNSQRYPLAHESLSAAPVVSSKARHAQSQAMIDFMTPSPLSQTETLTIMGTSLRGSIRPNQESRRQPHSQIYPQPASDSQRKFNSTSTASIDLQSWEARTGGEYGTCGRSSLRGSIRQYPHKSSRPRPQTAPLQRKPEAAPETYNTSSTATIDAASWKTRMGGEQPSGFGSISPHTKRVGSYFQTQELKPAPPSQASPMNEVAAWCKRLNDIGQESKRSNVLGIRASGLTRSVVRPSTAQPSRRSDFNPSYNTSSTQAIDMQSWNKRQDMRVK